MDIRLVIYYSMYLLSFALMGTHNALTRKKLQMSRRDVAVFIAAGILLGMLGAVVMAVLYNKIVFWASGGTLFSASRFRFFGTVLIMPFVLPFFLRKCGLRGSRFLDLEAVNCAACLGIVKIGCAVYGCCYGIPCEHGIYNRFADGTVFPVQLLECVFCLVSAAVLLVLLRKDRCKGFLYPVFMIEYSVGRFLIEYLRFYEYETEGSLVFGLSIWQCFCVLTVLLGVLQIIKKMLDKRKGKVYNTVCKV